MVSNSPNTNSNKETMIAVTSGKGIPAETIVSNMIC